MTLANGGPQWIDAADVEKHLPYPALIDALASAFVNPPTAPTRMNIPFAGSSRSEAGTLLVMPAVRAGGIIGVKLVTIHPGLAGRDGGALRSTYLVLDAASGEAVALIDGHMLTRRRTAAASVLAARLLVERPVETLLVVGTGDVAGGLAACYDEVMRPARILVWGRRPKAANDLATRLATGERPVYIEAVTDLREAVRRADVITVATLSREPLILREDVQPGTHVDLVGGFKPDMREADDELMAEANIVVDTLQACSEAGDIVGPVGARKVDAGKIVTLDRLIQGKPAHWKPHDISVFKSVGHALEDLAAAELVLGRR